MAVSTDESLSTRLRELRRVQRSAAARTVSSTRELVVVAFGVPVAVFLLVAVVALLTLVTADGDLTGLTAAIGAIWLAVHQVPLSVSEVTIGVLPLAPTIAVVAAVARMTASAARGRTPDELRAVVGAAVGGPLVLTVLASALVMDGSSAVTVRAPNVALALACTAAVHGLGAVIGVARGRGRAIAQRLGLPDWAPTAVRSAGCGLAGLFGVAAAVVLVRLMINIDGVGAVIESGGGVAGALGLTLLSILYLPNVVIGAAGLLVGAQVHVGAAGGDLFSAHGGAVPPLPILAVLPVSGGPGAALMLLTGVVAIIVGRSARHVDPTRATRTVAVTAAVAATVVVVLSWLAGGSLGELGSAGVAVPAAGVYTFAWFAVVGMLVVLVHGLMPATRRSRTGSTTERGEPDGDVAAATPEPVEIPAAAENPAADIPTDDIPADDIPADDIPADDIPTDGDAEDEPPVAAGAVPTEPAPGPRLEDRAPPSTVRAPASEVFGRAY
ncbi:DUF6350 family protein [Williamsia sp. CHRR-6]|uniref:cell division protein PerM n=1 Tax=Williamsia sp. CHRR-6 TaxID=2835871 RepID=UPI001BDABD4C|nr:DUF6350 family protein [Williamsia sp. CHRR-6]MBT0566558.1 hypothetical protein [Williamsia sp. CHRR-6]